MRHDERESCPCKRNKCPRHGDCAACREYHKDSRYRTACEQGAQKELKTPFGTVNIRRNGQKINFKIEYFDYGLRLDGGTFKRPSGLYKLFPNMKELEKGDIVVCEFDSGHLQEDGGDEFMANIVGIYQGYTIGMGAPDSQDIEDHYTGRERVLPYETWGSTGKGFEIHIIDFPEKYSGLNSFQELCFVVAWDTGTADENWRLISFVTC